MKKSYVPAVVLLTMVLLGTNLGKGGWIAYSAPVNDAPKRAEQNSAVSAVPADLRYVFAGQTEWPPPALEIGAWSKTPPMGFSYWNGFGDNPGPSDELSRQIADALVDTGLKDAGYVYSWHSMEVGGQRAPIHRAMPPDSRELIPTAGRMEFSPLQTISINED